MEKQCSKCLQYKDASLFWADKSRKDGLQDRCKECKRGEPVNKEKRKETSKKWREANSERHQASKKAWNEKNKHKVAWRTLLRNSIKSKSKKTNKTEVLLGYSAEEFKLHIESLWQEGMSWENHGEWHIDHIIPINNFPENTPPSVVNSLKNLRPIWATENLSRPKKAPLIQERPCTIFLDIDGSLVNHNGTLTDQMGDLVLLPGVKEKFEEWDKKGYKIILTTGRKESMRELTVKQLQKLGLFWDNLIMGLGGGQRIIINDMKPNSYTPTAIAINLKRNEGLNSVQVEDAIRMQSLAMFYGINI